jgi:hypothetical protein
MITHVVCWKVVEEADGRTRPEILQKMKEDLEALAGTIPELESISVGINAKEAEAASDVVLLSTFADWDALERYQVHPAHQEVVAFVKTVVTERRVVDFES